MPQAVLFGTGIVKHRKYLSDDAAAAQLFYIGIAIARLAQNFVAMLAERGRSAIIVRRCVLEFYRICDGGHSAGARMRQVHPHPTMLDLLLLEYFSNRVDRAARHADFFQRIDQISAGPLCENL